MSSIDRLRKLIALSGSPNEHEARSAAYLACKMIREGGFRVSEPAEDPWRPQRDRDAAPPRRPPPRRPAPDLRPRRPVASEVGRARRSGSCAVCGEAFAHGSDVAYPTLAADEKLGVVHADCRRRWTVLIDP